MPGRITPKPAVSGRRPGLLVPDREAFLRSLRAWIETHHSVPASVDILSLIRLPSTQATQWIQESFGELGAAIRQALWGEYSRDTPLDELARAAWVLRGQLGRELTGADFATDFRLPSLFALQREFGTVQDAVNLYAARNSLQKTKKKLQLPAVAVSTPTPPVAVVERPAVRASLFPLRFSVPLDRMTAAAAHAWTLPQVMARLAAEQSQPVQLWFRYRLNVNQDVVQIDVQSTDIVDKHFHEVAVQLRWASRLNRYVPSAAKSVVGAQIAMASLRQEGVALDAIPEQSLFLYALGFKSRETRYPIQKLREYFSQFQGEAITRLAAVAAQLDARFLNPPFLFYRN